MQILHWLNIFVRIIDSGNEWSLDGWFSGRRNLDARCAESRLKLGSGEDHC